MGNLTLQTKHSPMTESQEKHGYGQELSVSEFRLSQCHMAKPLIVSAAVIQKRNKKKDKDDKK